MYLQFIGMTTPDCMKLAIEMFNNEVQLEEFSASYYKNIKKLTEKAVPLKAGFLAYLVQIKKLNIPLGIVTSSPSAGVETNFSHYEFLSDFKVIVTREDVSQFKPNPEPYLLACEQLAVKPHQTIVFEDSNTGASAALNAGCYTIGIPDLVSFNEEVTKRLDLQINSFESLL